MSSVMDDDIIEVKLSSGSIAALAKAMGGGGKKGSAGGGGLAGLGGLKKIGMKGMVKLGVIGIAIGAILGVVKNLAGSSPMLKQMFKLMNFGIMMIFRPIGDFIGFMLRPILVMLLRNFIIPWYKDAMPIMQSMGAMFGGSMAKDLEAFFKNPEQVIADAFTGLSSWATDGLNSMLDGTFDWVKLGEDIVAGLLLIFRDFNPAFHITKMLMGAVDLMDWDKINGGWVEVGNKIRAAIDGWFQGGIDGIVGGANFIGEAIEKWWSDGINGLTWELSFIWNDITGAWNEAFNGLTWDLSFLWSDFEKLWSDGLALISIDWGKLVDNFLDFLNPFTSSSSSSSSSQSKKGNFMYDEGSPGEEYWNPTTWANGGHITEPIAGIGKSGQQYLMGEAGNETVTPDSQLGKNGITLNISIGNISSEGDMRNFETRVMEVLENANSRRGRL